LFPHHLVERKSGMFNIIAKRPGAVFLATQESGALDLTLSKFLVALKHKQKLYSFRSMFVYADIRPF
jgi:hypothetical protein